MTAVFEFVEDQDSRCIGGSGWMEDSVLCVLRRLWPQICLVRCVVTSGRSQERGGEM